MDYSKRRNVFLFLYVLILWGIFGYGIEKIYGFSVFQDEFGYWANAAGLIGYDWSECAGLGSYYSYGYGLILTVFLKISQNSMTAYRMAVAGNAALLCITMLLLWNITDILFKNVSVNRKIFCVGISFFYPVSVFYMQMTLTESLLTFLYVLICYLILCFCDKEKVSTVILLAVVLNYIFFVHMRTVGAVCACILVMGWWGCRHPTSRKKLLIGGMVFLLCFILGMALRQVLKNTVYCNASYEMLSANEALTQMEKIKALLSAKGICDFCYSLLGKLYYLGMATYGTIYFAIIYFVRQIKHPIAQFVLLSCGAQILISAIYMMTPGRIDHVIYGRYNDYLLLLFILIGVMEMFQSKHMYRKIFAVVFGHGVVLLILIRYMEQEKLQLLKGYFAAGIGYIWKARKLGDTDVNIGLEMCRSYLLSISLIILLVLCVTVIRHIRNTDWILGVFLCVEILLSMILSREYTFLFNEVNYGCMNIIDYLQEHDSKQIVYLDEGGFPYVDLVQFYLRDRSIKVWSNTEGNDWKQFVNEDVFLLINTDCSYMEDVSNVLEPCVESGNLNLYECYKID